MKTFKVILVGEPGVGKTQLLRTFAGEKFSEAHTPTRGVECTPVKIFLEGQEVTLELWDTATWWCHDRFRNVTTKQYAEAHAVVYVYDSTNFQSLCGLRAAFDEVVRSNEHCVKILVGTKYDLKPKNLINKPINQGQVLATTLSLPYFEVSAKVSPPAPESAFFALAKTLLTFPFPNHLISKSSSVDLQALTIVDEKENEAEGSSCGSQSPTTSSINVLAPTTNTNASTSSAAYFHGGDLATNSTQEAKQTEPPFGNTSAPYTPSTYTASPALPYTPSNYVAPSPIVSYHTPSPSPLPVTTYVIRSPQRYVAPANAADPFGLSTPDFDREYNVVLLGDCKVGKTQLLRAFVDEDFSETYVPSTGVVSCSKVLDVDGYKIKLQLWDTPGTSHADTHSTLQNAHGVVILYDMTESATFGNCQARFELAQGKCSPNARMVLVGNKTDLPDKTVETNEAQNLANSLRIPLFEISARASFNVETMFRALIRAIRTISANR